MQINVTESTKERLKQLLAPVVALELPVIGVISDAHPTELQAVAEIWPNIPHQICQLQILEEYAATGEGALNPESKLLSNQEWWLHQPDGELQLQARLQ